MGNASQIVSFHITQNFYGNADHNTKVLQNLNKIFDGENLNVNLLLHLWFATSIAF